MTISKFSLLLLLLFVFIGGILNAQEEEKFNRFSLEAMGGMHFPLSPNEGINTSEYSGLKQFMVAGRYMFSEEYGIKVHYAHNSIVNKNNSELGMIYNRGGVEGVANLGKILNIVSARRTFGVLAHTGIGITFASPSSSGKTERIGNFLIGITPEVKLTKSLTLLGDVTYAGNFRQHFAYNGVLFPDKNYQSGSVMNVSIGLMYSFGSKDIHADWY